MERAKFALILHCIIHTLEYNVDISFQWNKRIIDTFSAFFLAFLRQG